MRYYLVPVPDGDGDVTVRVTWHLSAEEFDALIAERQAPAGAITEFLVSGRRARSYYFRDGAVTVVVIGSQHGDQPAADVAVVPGRAA